MAWWRQGLCEAAAAAETAFAEVCLLPVRGRVVSDAIRRPMRADHAPDSVQRAPEKGERLVFIVIFAKQGGAAVAAKKKGFAMRKWNWVRCAAVMLVAIVAGCGAGGCIGKVEIHRKADGDSKNKAGIRLEANTETNLGAYVVDEQETDDGGASVDASIAATRGDDGSATDGG